MAGRSPHFVQQKTWFILDVAKKDRLWKEKAAELGKPVLVLKTWYTSLRSRYGRLKKKSGDPDPELTEQEEWILKAFEFLRPYVYDVQKRTAVSLKEKIAGTAPAADKNQNGDTPGLSSSGSAIQVVLSTSSRSSLITTRARAQRQAEVEEAALESIQQRGEQLISLQKQMVEQMKPSGDREREAFVEWIRTVILDLDHSLWRRFQNRISNLTYQFIAENDKIKTTPASSSQGRQPFQPNSMSQASSSQWPGQPTSQGHQFLRDNPLDPRDQHDTLGD
ncbi:hypothetical protein O3P69_011084 [Scylla paramamosain]|uniref:MADF domain-containing protein n=1 Tax=Scylla paramamosain TaxID=85552 RepID=A0AAW0SSJ3_SCYPA